MQTFLILSNPTYVVTPKLRVLIFTNFPSFALLALKWPFIGQPDNHKGWDTSMPFASINHIFIGINPWKFGNIIIKKSLFTKLQNHISQIFNSKIIFLFVSSIWIHIRLKWWSGMDETQFTWLPRFPFFGIWPILKARTELGKGSNFFRLFLEEHVKAKKIYFWYFLTSMIKVARAEHS